MKNEKGKKGKIRWLSVLLTGCLLLSMIPATAFATEDTTVVVEDKDTIAEKTQMSEQESTPGESRTEESVTDESKTDESITDESKADKSIKDESKADESIKDENKTGENNTEESSAEEGNSGESKTEFSILIIYSPLLKHSFHWLFTLCRYRKLILPTYRLHSNHSLK